MMSISVLFCGLASAHGLVTSVGAGVPLATGARVAPLRMGLGSFIGRFRKKKELEAAEQIAVGAVLPEVDVQVLPPPTTMAYEEDEAEFLPPVKTCTIQEALGPGKSLLVGMPGAFTPTCESLHLPGYMKNAQKLSSCGIDRIGVVTTNDYFVNQAWRSKMVECTKEGWDESMSMISDGDGDLVKALGLVDDMGFGLGARSKRFTLIINDGIVDHVAVDDGMEDLVETSAEKMLNMLRPAGAEIGLDLDDEQSRALAALAALGLAAAAWASTNGGLAAFFA